MPHCMRVAGLNRSEEASMAGTRNIDRMHASRSMPTPAKKSDLKYVNAAYRSLCGYHPAPCY